MLQAAFQRTSLPPNQPIGILGPSDSHSHLQIPAPKQINPTNHHNPDNYLDACTRSPRCNTDRQAHHAVQHSSKIRVINSAGHPTSYLLPSSPPFRLKTLGCYRSSTTANEEDKAIAYIRNSIAGISRQASIIDEHVCVFEISHVRRAPKKQWQDRL